MLLSQRIDGLAKIMADKPRVAKALSAFTVLADFRNLLVHGDGHVSVDSKGRWQLRLDCFTRAGPVQRCISEDESDALFRQIHQSVQRLDTLLKT
jgi:hypothetical protein